MMIHFSDGTEMTLPDGPHINSFLEFDLPWLVYVHGKVTQLDKQSKHLDFSIQLPLDKQAEYRH